MIQVCTYIRSLSPGTVLNRPLCLNLEFVQVIDRQDLPSYEEPVSLVLSLCIRGIGLPSRYRQLCTYTYSNPNYPID
jgi:hypothetical protein